MSYGLRGYDGRLWGLGADNVTGQVSADGLYAWDGHQWQSTTPAAPPVVYVAPVQPGNEVCQPWDTPCIQRNNAAQVGYQQAIGVAQSDTDYERCIANGTAAGTCRARWPVGYSGEVPFINLTPAQQAAQMLTPGQASAQYSAAAAATDLQVKAELAKAGQSPAAIAAAFAPPAKAGAPAGSAAPGSPDLSSVLQLGSGGTGLSAKFAGLPIWAWLAGGMVGAAAMSKGGR